MNPAALRMGTLLGSIATAVLASACCVGPFVFALLGLGGAGLLMKMEPFRPAFSLLTLGLLAAGHVVSWRARRTSGPDCGCPRPASQRAGRVLLWGATVLVAALLCFPYLAPYLLL